MTGKCRRICRFEAEQLNPGRLAAPANGAGGLLLVALNVEPGAEADFNAWHDEEHTPALAAVRDALRRAGSGSSMRVSEGRQRYLALYHLASPQVQASEAWKQAIETSWTRRIRPRTRDRLRLVLRRYTTAPH